MPGWSRTRRASSAATWAAASPERDIPRFLGLYKRGKLPVERLKSGSLPLSEINAGFDRLADGNVLRQVLRPNG